MIVKFLNIKVLQAFFVGCLVMLAACNGGADSEDPEGEGTDEVVETDPANQTILNVGNKLFNVPSPIEMAMLIKETEGTFNAEWLHTPASSANYNTEFERAINLGVYSADLGYLLSFGQSSDALEYLGTCRKLGTALSIPQEYYVDLIQRFEGNMGNPDSLTQFMAKAYQISDAYLKANQSENISTLILCGGWIESLHYATQVAKVEGAVAVKTRVGEQKSSLNNIIELMSTHKGDPQFDELVGQLKELVKLFDDIEYNYTYVEPTTDTANQVTIINSTSETKITDEQLNAITEKIEAIRKSIIG